MTAATMCEGRGRIVPEGVQVVAEKPFCVTWQLPSYPGAKLVACGVDIAALHCWPQAADRILVYGKVELTACYESKEEEGKYYFASATRYLSLDMNAQQSPYLEQHMVQAHLAVGPACTLTSKEQQRTDVQVDGIIRLVVPTILEAQTVTIEGAPDEKTLARSESGTQTKATTATELVAPVDIPPPRKGVLPSYTAAGPLSRTTAIRSGAGPNSPEPGLAAPERTPFFPPGAESIPPIMWTMPERG